MGAFMSVAEGGLMISFVAAVAGPEAGTCSVFTTTISSVLEEGSSPPWSSPSCAELADGWAGASSHVAGQVFHEWYSPSWEGIFLGGRKVPLWLCHLSIPCRQVPCLLIHPLLVSNPDEDEVEEEAIVLSLSSSSSTGLHEDEEEPQVVAEGVAVWFAVVSISLSLVSMPTLSVWTAMTPDRAGSGMASGLG